MKRLTILIFTFLIVQFSFAQAWGKIETPPIGGILDMHFTDINNGIASGWGGEMIITHDGGASWTKIDAGIGVNEMVPNLHMVDQFIGYAISNNGTLIKTIDGGYNWQHLNSGTDRAVRGLYFINKDIGFYCGQSQMIAKTANGGNSWNIQEFGAYWLRDIYFPTPDTGYCVGDGGHIMKSTDQGNTWEIIMSGGAPNLRYVYFLSTDTGYVCGKEGYMIKTTDGGASWTQLYLGTSVELRSIYFFNISEGYVVGEQGLIMHTYDGGLNWIDESIPIGDKFFRIFFADDTTGYICGFEDLFYKYCIPTEAGFIISHNSGLEYSFEDTSKHANSYFWDFGDGYYSSLQNPLHAYADTGIYNVCLYATGCSTDTSCQELVVLATSVSEFSDETNLSIFPNPCSGVFNITFGEVQDAADIKVFNPQGMLISDIQLKGEKSCQLDIRNGAKGIYLLQIKYADKVVTKKVIYK